MKLDWRKTFLIGLGFLAISIVWQLYNLYVPLFLQGGNPAFQAETGDEVLGFGLNATTSGFIMTLDNIAALFILPLIGVWSDRTRTRIGRRYPYILLGAPIAAIAFAVIPIAAGMITPETNGSVEQNSSGFALFMVAAGTMLLGMALFRTPVIALMPDLTPSPLRGKANGIINLMGGIGGVIATLGLGALFDINHIAPFIVGSVLMIAAIILLFFTVREPETFHVKSQNGGAQPDTAEQEREQVQARQALKDVRTIPPGASRSLLFLLLAIFGWFVGYNAIETFFSSYAVTRLNISAGTAGLLFSVALISFIVFAIPAGYIGARFGRKKTILVGLAIFAVLLVIAFFVPNTIVVGIILAVGGAAWALVNINSLPMVVDTAEDERLLGTYTGLYYLASQLAAILGPVLNGAIIDLTGQNYSSIFLVTPAFFVLAIVFMRFVTRGEAYKTKTTEVITA